MNQYNEYVEMEKRAGEIHVKVMDKLVLNEAEKTAAQLGTDSNEKVVEIGSGIATKAVVNELKKTGAFNPEVDSTVVVDSAFPVNI